MNVIKCLNGHFFDGDSYPTCPHCGAQAAFSEPSGNSVGMKPPKNGLFGKFKDKSKTTQQIQPGYNFIPTIPERQVPPSGNSITGVMTENNQFQSLSPDTAEKNPTLDFWQASAKEDKNIEFEPQKDVINNVSVSHSQNDLHDPISESPVSTESPESFSAKDNAAVQSSLTDTIKKASASSEGKTMSYFSSMTDKTENSSQKAVISDPVVGWLVSVSGNHFGESFQIGAGRNSIGRNDDNRIVLNKDNAISRSKHAIITYEPKKRNFYIQPGDSSGLTYLNDEYITEAKQLHSRDMIEIGDSKLIFIPLCGDEFTWEDFIIKE